FISQRPSTLEMARQEPHSRGSGIQRKGRPACLPRRDKTRAFRGRHAGLPLRCGCAIYSKTIKAGLGSKAAPRLGGAISKSARKVSEPSDPMKEFMTIGKHVNSGSRRSFLKRASWGLTGSLIASRGLGGFSWAQESETSLKIT